MKQSFISFDLWFQKRKSTPWTRSMAASSRLGSQSRMPRVHLKRQREQTGSRVRMQLSNPASNNVLPPVRSHHLNLLHPQTAPPIGKQVFKYLRLWDTLLIQTTTPRLHTEIKIGYSHVRCAPEIL